MSPPPKSVRAQSRRERELSCQTLHGHKLGNMELGAVALVSGVALVLYWNTLDADFAYDDSRAVKTNQDLLPSTPVSSLFRNDFWGTPLTHSGSHKSYRPVCVLTFRLNYYLGGLDPWGYHVVNVVLHAVVSALFTHMAALVFLHQMLPTLVAGLIFAAHPIHTEAVAGVVGRADVGACFFFLLSLLSYTKYCKYRDKENWSGSSWKKRLYLYSSLAWAACSMLTKEHGVTVLAVCAVYDVFINHKLSPSEAITIPVDFKRYPGLREGLLHIGGTMVLLIGLRLHLMGSRPPDFAPADNPAADSDSFLTRTLTFLYLPAFNFWLLVCPRWLSFDWSMEAIPLVTSLADLRNCVSVGFYSGLLYVISCAFRTASRRGDYSPGHTCSCMGYASQKLALNNNGSANHNAKYNKKQTIHILNNNSQNSYSPYCNGHRLTNGHSQPFAYNPSVYGWTTTTAMASPSVASASDSCDACGVRPSWSSFSSHLDAVIFAVALLTLPFIPATNLFFYVGFVVAERVLYVPSMGVCLLVALGADHLYRHQDTGCRRKFILGCLAALFIILSVRTVRRNKDWLTEENLYRSGIPINPPKAYGNLANILSAQGKKAEAEWAYKKALGYRSNMADVHYNLGILLQEQGRYEEALQSYRLAIQFRPRLAMAYLNMGLVLGILGRKDEAAEVYRHCAELDGTGLKDPRMHESTKISALFNLGRLYADEGKYEEAISVYQEAVRKMPDHYQPQSLYNMMGEAYFKLGQYEDAEYWYKEALRVKPDHIPAHLTYAKLLFKWNRALDAERWFLRAKTLAPNDSSVYQHYGQFLAESERHAEAAEVYVRAADLAPEEYEIVFNAANTLRQAGRNAEAEKFYQLAVKLRPNEVTSHMNLGAMLHVNGKLLEAESSYLEALRLKPDDPITQNNLQKLRNLLVQKGVRSSAIHSRR